MVDEVEEWIDGWYVGVGGVVGRRVGYDCGGVE